MYISKDAQDFETIVEALRCIRALLNNKVGLKGVIQAEGAVQTMVLCLDLTEGIDTKASKMLLDALTVICGASSPGHRSLDI